MKILFISHNCDPSRGSEWAAGWNWPYQIARRGHEVLVLTKPIGGEARRRKMLEEPALPLRFQELPACSCYSTLLPYQLRCWTAYWRWLGAAGQAAEAIVRDWRPDVIHHVSWGSLGWGSPFWRYGPPLVYGPIGGGQVAPGKFRPYLRQAWPSERFRSYVLHNLKHLCPSAVATLCHAEAVLVSNQPTERIVRAYGARRVIRIPDSAVNRVSQTAAPGCSTKTLRLVWVGRLLPIKGLELAMDIVAEVRNRIPVMLTIFGDGPLRGRLDGWITSRGLKGAVDYRGEAPHSEVMEAYGRHDLLLFTSLRDTLGSQVIEALSCGLPVATLDLNGAGEIVDNTCGVKAAVTTPRETIAELAFRIADLWRNPLRLAELSQGAIRKAGTVTWEQHAQRVESIYEEVAASRRAISADLYEAAKV